MIDEEQELDDQSDMDWGSATQQKIERRSRAVVSVAFVRDDFDRLDRHVERRGVKISEFIREAALDRLAAEQAPVKMNAAFAAAEYYAPAPKRDFVASADTTSQVDSRFVRVA